MASEQTDFLSALNTPATVSVKGLLRDKVKSAMLRDAMLRGCRCPCCGQRMQLYRRKITAPMARVLIFLCRMYSRFPDCEPVALESVLRRVFKGGLPRGNNHSLLRHWGLIERSERRWSKHQKREAEGCYRITEKGKQFAHAIIKVPKYVYLYDNECYGEDAEETVTIDAVLRGGGFTWHELMNAPVDWSQVRLAADAA